MLAAAMQSGCLLTRLEETASSMASGMMINGHWKTGRTNVGTHGRFTARPTTFHARILTGQACFGQNRGGGVVSPCVTQ